MTDQRRPGLLPRDWDRQPPALAPAYRSTQLRSPKRPLVYLPDAAAQVGGPVFGHDMIGPDDWDLLTNFAAEGQSAIGPRILLHGTVQDQNGQPVKDALIECWQANAGGRYRHVSDSYLAPLDPNFGGCGRTMTDRAGHYRFRTVLPGAYPWPNGPNSWRPAHIHLSIFGAVFAQRLITQCYFEGDPFIPLCPIVQAIPDQSAIEGLTARLDLDATIPHDTVAYRFDIVLRGRQSTYFENRPEGL